MVAAPTHFKVSVSSLGDAGVELAVGAECVAASGGRTRDDSSGIGHHLTDSPRSRSKGWVGRKSDAGLVAGRFDRGPTERRRRAGWLADDLHAGDGAEVPRRGSTGRIGGGNDSSGAVCGDTEVGSDTGDRTNSIAARSRRVATCRVDDRLVPGCDPTGGIGGDRHLARRPPATHNDVVGHDTLLNCARFGSTALGQLTGIQELLPPPGSVETSMFDLSRIAIHNDADGHEMLTKSALLSPCGIQADGPPVGSVDT